MSDQTKPNRVRGGNKSRPSRKPIREERPDNRVEGYPAGHILSKQNTCLVDRRGSQHTSLVEGAAIWFDGPMIHSESVSTHIVPRRSLTRKQLLPLYPIRGEVVDMRGKQAEKIEVEIAGVIHHRLTGKLINVTERKQISRNVGNLLRQDNPFKSIEKQKISRMASRSGRIESDKYKNYLGEVDDRDKMKTPAIPSRTYSIDDPIVGEKKA